MRSCLLLVATLLALAAPQGARADEATWQRALNAGEAAYRGGDYTEASFAFGIALKAAEDFGESDTRLATTLGWLAETYRLQGRLAEAEPLLVRALAIRERVLGPVHPSTHLTRHNLGALQKAIAASAAPAPAPAPAVAEVKPAPPRVETPKPEAPRVETPRPEPPPAVAATPRPVPPPRVEAPRPQPPAPITGAIELKPATTPPSPIVGTVDLAKPVPPPAPVVGTAVVKPTPAPPAPIIGAVDVARKPVPPAPVVGTVEVAKPKPVAPAPVVAKPEPPAPPPPPRIVEPAPKPTPPLEVVELKPKPPAPPPIVLAEPKPVAPVPVSKPEPPLIRAEPAAPRPAPPAPAVAVAVPKPVPPPAPKPAPTPTFRSPLAQQLAMLGTAPSQVPAAFELLQRARRHDAPENPRIASLARDVPAERNHLDPAVIALAAAQSLLGPDEALLSYFFDDQQGYVVAARRDRAAFHALGLRRDELAAGVKRLRLHLDPAGDIGARGGPPPFPFDVAHRLYASLLGPAAAILEGAAHVIVVADDALQSLPLAVLVTEPFDAARKDEAARPAWLARRHALTLLPAEASLQALRRGPAPAAGKPFAGFGDPMLLGDDRRTTPSGTAPLFRAGSAADVNRLRDLVRLPETRYVLDAMSDILNGDPRDVRVEADATEAAVKGASLADFRVLAFATYGLMAGEHPGAAEPGLVLTPPRAASALDDGLLTASEIAQLRLDAELVVLPESSTAAPDGTPGLDGLPRLSRAFLHAGARSIVVSHWPVSADSTLKLLSRMLRERVRGAGNAEALRRAMLALMNGEDRPAYAHPMYWAPLVVVGEGARR